MLCTGWPWLLLLTERSCDSGWTCWRPLRDREAAGVRERLHTRQLNWLGNEAAVDWSRASVDSINRWAKNAEDSGSYLTDRGKAGSKYHLEVDCTGIPLAVGISDANAHDSTRPLVDAIPPIIGPRGRTVRSYKRPARRGIDSIEQL